VLQQPEGNGERLNVALDRFGPAHLTESILKLGPEQARSGTAWSKGHMGPCTRHDQSLHKMLLGVV